jgi:MinD superfamily P-loop ATPase
VKIAIASGKGGTGKTTLATNLAGFISGDRNVLLADLDVEEPNSGLFIKAGLVGKEDKFRMIPVWNEDACILCDNCQKVCNFNAVVRLGPVIMIFPELCHGCYACSELCPSSALPMKAVKMGEMARYREGKLDFVESRLDIGQEQATPLISRTQKYIDEHFPAAMLKICDSPPGTSCPVIEATRDADFVILVTEPTPFGLHDLRLAVETMDKLGRQYGVVINRDGIGNDDVLEWCGQKNIPVLGRIPNNRRIAELYSEGKLVYPEIPEVRRELEKILDYITGSLNMP